MLPRRAPLLLAVPLLATACGSRGAATTVARPSQAHFVRQANEVCIRADRRIYQIGSLTRSPAGWAKAIAVGRSSLAAMRNVKPPEESAAAYRRMMDYAARLVAATKVVHDDLVAKRFQSAVAAQSRAARLQADVHAQAKAAGLTFCQQPATSWPL